MGLSIFSMLYFSNARFTELVCTLIRCNSEKKSEIDIFKSRLELFFIQILNHRTPHLIFWPMWLKTWCGLKDIYFFSCEKYAHFPSLSSTLFSVFSYCAQSDDPCNFAFSFLIFTVFKILGAICCHMGQNIKCGVEEDIMVQNLDETCIFFLNFS